MSKFKQNDIVKATGTGNGVATKSNHFVGKVLGYDNQGCLVLQEVSARKHSGTGIIQGVLEDNFELAVKVFDGYASVGDVIHAVDNFYNFTNAENKYAGVISEINSPASISVQSRESGCCYPVAGEHFALGEFPRPTYHVGDTLTFKDGVEGKIVEDEDNEYYLLEDSELTILYKCSIDTLMSEAIRLHGDVESVSSR